MPSEKRRQKIRNEPGDFVPSCSKDKLLKDDENFDNQQFKSSIDINESKVISQPNKKNTEKNITNAKMNESGKGKTKTKQTQLNVEKKPNVVYAEEKTYEPVRIMESKTRLSTPDDSKYGSKKEKSEDSENFPTYSRRRVVNNWAKYELPPTEDDIEEGEDYMLGEDFNDVIKNAGSCTNSVLGFKTDSSWLKGANPLDWKGLGDLNVADLVCALDTIPLHHRLKIDEKILPPSSVKEFNEKAKRHLKSYKPGKNRKSYVDTAKVNQHILDALKLSEDSQILLQETVVIPNDSKDLSKIFEEKATEKLVEMFSESDKEKFSINKDVKHDKNEINTSTAVSTKGVSEGQITDVKVMDFGLSTLNQATLKSPFNDSQSNISPVTSNTNNNLPVVDESLPVTFSISLPVVEDTFKSDNKTSIEKASTATDEIEDLEDWLDSVLED